MIYATAWISSYATWSVERLDVREEKESSSEWLQGWRPKQPKDGISSFD
jgi:hypothetical protein